MSLKSSNKISANEYEVEIQISPKDFSAEIDKVYKKEIKKISIPGFRKGKAPRAFVEKYYGDKIFHEEAIRNLYPSAIDSAVKELKIDIVDLKKLEVLSSSKEDGVVFKTVIVAEPEVEIDGYKGIEMEKLSDEVTKEDIDKEIENLRLRNSRLVDVESRPAKMGDTVTIDFEGFIDDKQFEGGSSQNFSLELGKNQFISGFEEQVAGHNKDEEFSINVKFPSDYHNKNYADKDAVFKVKIHEIKERELPNVDDDFVKDISEFDTLKEYKDNLQKELQSKKKLDNEAKIENHVAEKIAQLVKADIPEAMIEKRLDDIMKDFGHKLQAQGINIKDYVKYTGASMDSMRDQFRPQAETQVKLALGLKKISELENISPTDEDIEDEYKKIAQSYNIEPEKVKVIVPREDIEKDVKTQKAMEIVKNNLSMV